METFTIQMEGSKIMSNDLIKTLYKKKLRNETELQKTINDFLKNWDITISNLQVSVSELDLMDLHSVGIEGIRFNVEARRKR
jgi:hypothetical protein